MSPASPPPPQARGWASPRSRHPRAAVLRSLLRVGTLADSGSPLQRGVRAVLRAVRSAPRGHRTDRQVSTPSGAQLQASLGAGPGSAPRAWACPQVALGRCRPAQEPLSSVTPSAPGSVFLTDSFVGVEFGSLALVEWGQARIMCNFG